MSANPSRSDSRADDRDFLRWLRDADSTELRARRALYVRTFCHSWQARAVERELDRRVETPPAVLERGGL